MPSPFLAVASSSLGSIDAWLSSWLLRTSWQAAVLIALVVIVQLTLGKWLAPRWRYALWMLVVVRLLMPVLPESPLSVFNFEMPRGTKIVADRAAASATPPAAEGVTVTIVRTFDADDKVGPVAPAQVAAKSSFDWRHVLLAIWLAGAIVMTLRVVIAHVLLTRRLRHAPGVETEVLATLDDCRREMGVQANARVIATDAVGGPALFGFFRPKLLVPPALLKDLGQEDLRFVFLHELAHLKRRDTLINIGLTLAQAVHWFNPLVWFALSRCRTERELACDAMVLELTDGPAQHGYGDTILRLAEMLCTTRRRHATLPAALGLLPTRSQLTRRITMISAFRRSASSRSWSLLPMLMLVGVASCALTDKASSDAPATAGATTQPAPTVAELTAQSKQLVNETRYADALAVLDRILTMDPTNDYAAGVRPLVKDKAALQARRAAGKQDEPVATTEPQPDEANKATQAILDRKLPELKLENISFTDVIDALRDLTNANIFVNWRALEGAGIDRETPVTARLRDAKVSKALDVILTIVGNEKAKLGYTIDDGVITVSTKDDLAKNTLTRVYDIRDLIVEVPDYAPEAKAVPAPTTQPQSSLIEQITDLIRETVEPDAWRDNGGTIASLRELSGQLIITATPEMHVQIGHLLTQVREGRGVQVTVEARFITVDQAAMDKALGGRLKSTMGKSGEATVWQLDDDEVRAILDSTQKSEQGTTLIAPRLTLFSGQRGHVTVATRTAYVSTFTVIKKDGGETRYEPKIDVVSPGIVLDVRATTTADRKSATLTLKPKLSRLESLIPVKYPDTKDLTIQVPHLSVHELQTTLTVPDRGTALIGGFTETLHSTAAAFPDVVKTTVAIPEGGKLLATGVPTTQPANANVVPSLPPSHNLYLLVKPTLVLPAAETPKQFPILSPKNK